MRFHRPRRSRRLQGGLALVALMAIIALGSMWYFVSALNAASNRTGSERAATALALSTAKQAVLGWMVQQAALSTERNPGRLPCPEPLSYVGDATNEGTAGPGIGGPSCASVGRLPWRTLGIERITDGTGEPLWYVVPGNWRLTNPGTPPALGINSNFPGQLNVDGQANAAVAVIIAPGRPIPVVPNANQLAAGCAARTQTRIATPPNSLDYLECQDGSGTSVRTNVVDNATNLVLNDQVVVISAAEVFAALEPVIARRIQAEVAPAFLADLTTWNNGWNPNAAWATAPVQPIYPYAAPFADPSVSPLEGTNGTLQGLLPLTRAQGCTPGTDPRCDPGFVGWNTGAIAVTKVAGNGTITASNCSASTGTLVTCTVNYQRACSGFTFSCSLTLSPRVQVSVQNVGMTLKARPAATPAITGYSGVPTFTLQTLAADGSAATTTNGAFSTYTCTGFPIVCAYVRTITIALPAFNDLPFLSPTTADAWYWFIANNWHQVTYYAVSPAHAPNGPLHNCQSAGNCIAVTGGTPASLIRATLVLAGRSVTNTARPNADLADFLDSAENRNADTAFEQRTPGPTFNDRFVAIGNY